MLSFPRMREELMGRPFNMFDLTPVGIALAAAGVVFLAFGYAQVA
jgi:hypothetical protein